jgi:hypothetical protein
MPVTSVFIIHEDIIQSTHWHGNKYFFDGWNHGIPIVNLFLDCIRIKAWEGMERHDSGLEVAAVDLTDSTRSSSSLISFPYLLFS